MTAYGLQHLLKTGNVLLQGTGTLAQGNEEEGKIQAVYPGQAQPLGAMQSLALQIRKLQKKQKYAAKELKAAAAREAFWRDTAQATEQALDQVCRVLHALASSIPERKN